MLTKAYDCIWQHEGQGSTYPWEFLRSTVWPRASNITSLASVSEQSFILYFMQAQWANKKIAKLGSRSSKNILDMPSPRGANVNELNTDTNPYLSILIEALHDCIVI